jgi:anti-sigma factor RsiW
MNEETKMDLMLGQALRQESSREDPKPGPCQPAEELSAYLDGVLPGPQREALEEHLLHCEACRLNLAAAAQAMREPAPAEVPRQWLDAARAAFEPSAPPPSRPAAAGQAAGESWLERLRTWFTWPKLAPAGALAITVALTLVILTSLPVQHQPEDTRATAPRLAGESQEAQPEMAAASKPLAPKPLTLKTDVPKAAVPKAAAPKTVGSRACRPARPGSGQPGSGNCCTRARRIIPPGSGPQGFTWPRCGGPGG